MTRSPPPPLVYDLQSSNTIHGQLIALRTLKNELIGAEQKKKVWIGLGIVPILSNILQSPKLDNGKQIDQNVEAPLASFDDSQGMGVNDSRYRVLETRIQVVEIIGSLAQAGSQFVGPIIASDLLTLLLTMLAAHICPLVLAIAILRTLNTIADRLPNGSHGRWPRDHRLADLLYSNDNIDILPKIIGQHSGNNHSMSLAASLLCKTLRNESQRTALCDAGILGALATRLAMHIVEQGFVLPGADLPEAAQTLNKDVDPRFCMAPVLEATAIMIEGSDPRTNDFLSSLPLTTVFPRSQTEIPPSEIKKSPWGSSTYLSGSAVPRLKNTVNPIDALLPSVPSAPPIGLHNTSFPPLGAVRFSSSASLLSTQSTLGQSTQFKGVEDGEESTIIPWLIHAVRSESTLTRTMAAKLLVTLFRLGRTRRDRASMFCMLLVPLLVNLLNKDFEFSDETLTLNNDVLPARTRVKEEAPGILASLIIDDKPLQTAAFNADAVRKLSLLLKETFDPLPNHLPGMWTPQKTHGRGVNQPDLAMKLGSAGPTPQARHIMKLRENILKAMAAIAANEENFRKALCEQGVIPYITDALKPYSSVPPLSERTQQMIPGNSAETLLAACGAIRALTRSPNIIRTDLVDASIATPLLDLLREPDVDVQTAATAVLCNLSLQFSPMKQAISHDGIIRLLADHAHHGQQRLRIESVWALKHIALHTQAEVKMSVFQHLGGRWIQEIVASEYHAAPYRSYHDHTRKGTMVGANANGEHVDILNPTNTDGDSTMYELGPSSKPKFEIFKRNIQARRLAQAESEPYTDEARNGDVALQEQTIDLLRNMLCGSATPSVVEYVWNEMNNDFFLEMLTDRLRPRNIPPKFRSNDSNSSRKDSLTSGKIVQPRAEIVLAVTYLLIHIAAGEAKYRRMLASHHELLKLTSALCEHPSAYVRINIIWMTSNLLYQDHQVSFTEARDRARLLESLQFRSRMRSLQDDTNLDCRERVKTALSLMDDLLGRD
ncbi:MAG: hypothetical protein Q9160_008927 [Pyrenula sp. 1 TL-2023]